MEVQVKEVDYCKLEILYTGDSDVVSSKRDEVVADLRKTQIPGFRKGKAPDSAIKAKLGKQIDIHIAEYMKSQAYDDAIFKIEQRAIGYPKFDDVSISGNNFKCKITLLTKPSFEVADYKYEIPNPDIDRDIDAQVNSTLEDLRLRFGDVEPYGDNDFVDTNDQITIGFTATVNGEPFDGSTAEGQLYVVGQNAIPGLDDNLLGMSAGESRSFELTLPENVPGVGGSTALFNVTVHMGTKKAPAALDDVLATQCGFPTFEELKSKLESISAAKIKQAHLLKVRQQVAERLVSENDFRVPDILIQLESQHIAAQNGIDWSLLDDTEKQVFTNQAVKQVRLSMILDSIREKEPDSVLSDGDAQAGLVKRASLQGRDPKKFLVDAQQSGSLLGMMSALKDEFTLQWLVDQAKIIE